MRLEVTLVTAGSCLDRLRSSQGPPARRLDDSYRALIMVIRDQAAAARAGIGGLPRSSLQTSCLVSHP